jgi:uncharacterized protein YrrD
MLKGMLLEASHLTKGSVVDIQGLRCGQIDRCVFSREAAALAGFQVATGSVVSRFRGLDLTDCISLNHEAVVVDSADDLHKDLHELDEIAAATGPVIGVAAMTESGDRLGTVSDVLLDADTGLIVRFYLRRLLVERIIPRQYLLSITPKQVVFKDVVNTPVFTQVATADLGTS